MKPANQQLFPKTPAGTDGLDEITGGGCWLGKIRQLVGNGQTDNPLTRQHETNS
jgi:hypothetical protein